MNYWLVKSEPITYSWQQFTKDKTTIWDGVRNYQARNNLQSMKKGDLVLYYHSNDGMEVVGIAKVHKEFFQDPTTDDSRWVSVELKVFKALKKAVPLSIIKSDERLKNISLVRQGRLSVMSLTPEEFDRIIELGS